MLAPAPVYPDEAHADGDGDDGAEDAEEEEQEDALRGLHLEQRQEVVIQRGQQLIQGRPCSAACLLDGWVCVFPEIRLL